MSSLKMERGKKKSKKKEKEPYKYHKCVIGVDQSYSRTGISIAIDGKLKKVTSVKFTGCKCKTEKRDLLRDKLSRCLEVCIGKYGSDNVAIVFERIRTITSGESLRPQVIKASAALCAVIVDCGYHHTTHSYSVDTRAWKRAIIGTSGVCEPIEGVKNPNKYGSVRKLIDLGFESSIYVQKRNGGFEYDDDAADSACIALYPFKAKNILLTKEE